MAASLNAQIESLSIHPPLHNKINLEDLDEDGFVVSKNIRESLFAYQESHGFAESFKLSRKVSPIPFGAETPRSVLFVNNKIFALYRDMRLPKVEGWLGWCHNGKVKLAQDLDSGVWVAVKIVTEGSLQETENLNRLGRLVAHIPSSAENKKEYLLQSLLQGKGGSEECTDAKQTVAVFLSVFRELQRFHQSGLCHHDCGVHNFIYNRETNQSTIIDFETSEVDPERQYSDNERILSELLVHLELNNSFCNSIQKRKALLAHPILFDAAVKLLILLRSADGVGSHIEDLSPMIQLIQNAYDCEFNGSEVSEGQYFSCFPEMQKLTNLIKEDVQERFAMPICDYIEKVKKAYPGNLEDIVGDIEEYKRHWLLIGQTKLTDSELDGLPRLDQILHYTACKNRVEEMLLREKSSSFWPWEKKISKEVMVELLGGSAVIEECERQLQA